LSDTLFRKSKTADLKERNNNNHAHTYSILKSKSPYSTGILKVTCNR